VGSKYKAIYLGINAPTWVRGIVYEPGGLAFGCSNNRGSCQNWVLPSTMGIWFRGTAVAPDITAPSITAPDDVTVEGNLTGGADGVVLGAPTVSDDVDPSPVVTNDAPATYPLGDTNVTWTAEDASLNLATAVQVVSVVDTTDAVLTIPADVTEEATGAETAVAIGSATATDIVDANPVITNDAPATFPVGSTDVIWTAEDATENSASATQVVTVEDTTPPNIAALDDIVVVANGLSGIVVNFSADAEDIVDGTFAASCLPISGSTFPLGETTVTCSAVDNAGNAAEDALFTITVELVLGVEIQSVKLNLGKNGVLPVVVPGSSDVDVTRIDVSSLELNGAGAAHDGHIDDVDGDRIDDLMVHFPVPELAIAPPPADGDVVTLTLTGELNDGAPFEGADDVMVKVQKNNANADSNKKGGKGK